MTNRPQKFQETSRPCFLSVSLPFLPSPQAMAARKKGKGGKGKVVVSAQFLRQKFLPPTLHQLRPKKKKTKARKGIRDWQLRGQKNEKRKGSPSFYTSSLLNHCLLLLLLLLAPSHNYAFITNVVWRGGGKRGGGGGRRKSLTPVKREEEGGKASSSWYPTSSDAGFPRKPPQTAP